MALLVESSLRRVDRQTGRTRRETELQGIVGGLARNPREAVKKFEE